MLNLKIDLGNKPFHNKLCLSMTVEVFSSFCIFHNSFSVLKFV